MNTALLTENTILEALRHVIDPELGCNIVDLGLIYSIEIEGAKVKLIITFTTRGCPMHQSIAWGIKEALLNHDGVEEVEVEVVWDPPWNPSMMSEEGRARVGFVG